MQEIFCLENKLIDEILDRRRRDKREVPHISFSEIIKEFLDFANRFVAPSRSGTIYIDDPSTRAYDENGDLDYNKMKLIFTACFGDKSECLVGRSISANKGIAGYVYKTGESLLVNDVANNPFFDPAYSRDIGLVSDSILAVPIIIENKTMGVLQLINKKGKGAYAKRDLELVNYFCERYIVNNIVRAIEFKKDSLTGLYTQKYFEFRLEDKLDALKSKKKNGYLYFIDLDSFKEVNDTFGHRTGSRAIVLVADLLGSYVFDKYGRKGLTARYGGDEYEIFIPEIEQKEATELAKELCDSIARLEMEVIGKDGENINALKNVTASIGIASTSNNFTTVDEYIKLADKAMYRAKMTKNSICLLHNDEYMVI